MADPGTPYAQRKNPVHGTGPETFPVPELGPGDSWTMDFRSYNKGQYMSPTGAPAGWDVLEVTNKADAISLDVEINDEWKRHVPTNETRSVENSGMYRFKVENLSGVDTLPAGEAQITVLAEPLGADRQARDQATANPLERVVRNFTGL